MHSRLQSDDLFLFNQGTHYRLYDKLGAHVVAGGTYFAVWAPNARAVSVIGDWNDWQPGASPLVARESSGIWEGELPGIGQGSRYKFAVVGADGVTRDKADPFAFRSEHPPGTASIVWQAHHTWKDGAWMQSRSARIAKTAPVSIYECHLGSWRRERGQVMGYRDLGRAIARHCTNLGFTHVELLPVMEHPFYGSWGYQVTGFFAPTTRYGAPDDLMAMIDELHRAELGVIIDWVPAHFPTDAHGLGLFDGTHLYEHDDPRRGFHPDWTSYIFNYGRHEIRSFLISSAIAWLDRFHVDGLRVDGVASMLYLDYSRKHGEWIPNEDGSNHNRDAIGFLQQFNRAVYASYPDVHTIAEESTSWKGVTAPPGNGPEQSGLGFGYKWDLGWMHDTLSHLSRDPIHRRFHHEELTFRGMYFENESWVLPISHDEVVHGKRPLIGKMAGDTWQKLASLRLLFGYQWTLPGKKLMFMGNEIGVWREWNHDDQLDWWLGDQPAHGGIARWLGDLNGAYRKLPSLHVGDCETAGFKWINADDRDHGVIAYLRLGRPGDPPVMVACNFTPVPREGYRVGVPRGGRWREALNSDATSYGGGGMGNKGGMEAEAIAWHGHDHALSITVPALAIVVFVAEDAP